MADQFDSVVHAFQGAFRNPESGPPRTGQVRAKDLHESAHWLQARGHSAVYAPLDLIIMTDLPHPDPAGAARLLRGLKPAGLFVYENHYSSASPADLLAAFPEAKVIHSQADPHSHLERLVLEKSVE